MSRHLERGVGNLIGSTWDSAGTHVAAKKTKNPSDLRGVLGADDGTRTHDLLHGKSQRCSRPFAPVRSNRLFPGLPSKRANGAEPERTPNLAILATGFRRPRIPRVTAGLTLCQVAMAKISRTLDAWRGQRLRPRRPRPARHRCGHARTACRARDQHCRATRRCPSPRRPSPR